MAGEQTMENSSDRQDPIQRLADLVEESKRSYTETQQELSELQVLLEQTSGEVEKLDQRTAQVTNRLRHIEANLNSFPREDIKEAYSASQASQLRLVMLRSQVEQIEAKREILQSQTERLRDFLDIAEQVPGLSTSKDALSVSPSAGDSVVMRVIEAQEGERQRLARQMHDGPAQSLTNLILQAEIVEKSFDISPDQSRTELTNLRNAVKATFEKTMDFVFELSPMMLDDLGAVPTLRRYVEDFEEKSGLSLALEIIGEERRLAPHVEVTVFRVIQELLHNVWQHAHASHVQVGLDLKGSMIAITVEDDGSGFDVDEVMASANERKTLGITTMKQRIEMLGGTIQFDSSLGRGTKVTMSIPAA
jgi:two-component system sensor histidine kinase DegS